jgi:hypothetical protein
LVTVELKGKYNGSLYRHLIYQLKNQPKKLIRIVLSELVEHVKSNSMKLPYDMSSFINHVLKNQRLTTGKQILREEKLLPFLTRKNCTSVESKERVFQFINIFSPFSSTEFRRICSQTYNKLIRYYTTSPYQEDDYNILSELTHLPGIDLLRQKAFDLKVDLEVYHAQEEKLLKSFSTLGSTNKWQEHISKIFKKLHEFKTTNATKLDLPYKFNLEEYILKEIPLNRKTQLSWSILKTHQKTYKF